MNYFFNIDCVLYSNFIRLILYIKLLVFSHREESKVHFFATSQVFYKNVLTFILELNIIFIHEVNNCWFIQPECVRSKF